jgi:hypothetical protein
MSRRKSHRADPGELSAPTPKTRRRSGTSPTVLTAAQRVFATSYLRNGFNGRRAYLEAHPKASLRTADVAASKSLNIPKVRQWLAKRLEPIWKSRQMDGEQALARIAQIAAFDVRDLYDEQGALLNVADWPDSIVGVVRSVQDGPYGLKVSVESPHAALRTILEQTGKLRGPGESIDALADAIRADLTRHGQAVEE